MSKYIHAIARGARQWCAARPHVRTVAYWSVLIVFVLLLSVVMTKMYGERHAWGAWGDDSPGYQFLAARLFEGKPLIWQDELGKTALDYFGNYHQAQWILPMHHEFIHPDGIIASKYPTGASIFLAIGSWVGGSILSMYTVQPILGGVSVVFGFVLALLLFRHMRPWNAPIAIFSALLTAFSPLYISTVLAQPMREIPSIAVALAALIVFVPVVWRIRNYGRVDVWSGAGMFIAGVLYGLACTVRETSIMMLPAFMIFGVLTVLQKEQRWLLDWKHQWKTLLISAAVFAVAAGIGLAPIVANSLNISSLNEPFKERDTGSVVLLSNIDHLQTVSVHNMFNATGRYRPSSGSVPEYWHVMNEFTKLPFFVWIAIAGSLFGLYATDRATRTAVLTLLAWALGTLTIFSLWINPYTRYILPVLPVLSILAAFGIVHIARVVLRPRFGWGIAVVWLLCWGVAMTSVVKTEWDMQKRLRAASIIEQRGISRADAEMLEAVAKRITMRAGAAEVTEQNTVVLFTGQWRTGLDEVFWAQTGVRGVRLPVEGAEDQRQNVSTAELTPFIQNLLTSGVRVYVWEGASTTPDVPVFVKQFPSEVVLNHSFSFSPTARLIELYAIQ